MNTLFTKKSLGTLLLFLLFGHLKIFGQTSCPITGDSIVCGGDVETYTSTVTGAGPYTYQWNAFGGVATGSGNSTNIAWGNTGSGQVTLVVRDVANNVVCTSLLNVAIKAKPAPVITPSSIVGCGDRKNDQGADRKGPDCFAICDSTWITYTTPNNSGSSYNWIISGAAAVIPSTSNSIQVLWTSIGNGTVTVTETSDKGCVGTTSICVTIVGRPQAKFTSLNPIVGGIIQACLNQPIQFIDQSISGSGSNLISYQWLFGSGSTITGSYPGLANETFQFTTPGLHDVFLIVENECHCKDTFKMQVNVSSSPGPDITCMSTVCPGATVTYQTNASNCASYNWSVTNGTIVGSNTSSTVTVTWGSSGPATISLNVSGCDSITFCNTPTTLYVPLIPATTQINGPAQVCQYECYKYHISCSIPIDSIIWHLPTGVSANTSTTNRHEVELCFNDAIFTSGTVLVDYYHHTPGSTDGLSCGGQASLVINSRPRLFISAPTQICDQSTYTAYPSPPTSGNIIWEINNQAGTINYFTGSIPSSTPLSISNWPYGAGHFLITAKDTSGSYCNTPQSVSLTVNPNPPSLDTILGSITVCPNQPYQYVSLPTSSNYSVVWSIQNGTPTTGAGTSISVLWNATGPYSISASQIDPITGCKSDSITLPVGSMLPLPIIPPTGNITPCANGTNNYSVAASGDDFMWSISPSIAGSVSNGQHSSNATIQWNNYNGAATITLVRTVCGQTVSSTLNVTVGMPPAPVINPITTTCEGALTSFSSPTTATSYTWNFGDGTATSSLQNPTHVFNAPGNYIVTLTVVYSASCPATMSTTTNIMVNPKPNVTISTPDPNVFCGPIGTVNMAVAGPVGGITYNWYRFPSTTVATNTTTYSSNVLGMYYAIGTNGFGCVDTSNVISIDSICDTCSADPAYTLNFNRYRLGCNVDSFVGTYTAGAINPRWNFDDIYSTSNTASGNIATHLFKEPGYYRVRFCVDVPNIAGTGYCQKCVMQVDTIEYAPNFYDSLYCISGIDSVKVKFINNTKWLTTLPLPSYTWTVTPSGLTSNAINPTFGLAPGTYVVNLNVAGVCNFSKTITIPGFPNASFTSLDSVCVNAGMVFNNTSSGSYSSALWQFGDGASLLSTATPITRVYETAGTFTASLLLTNSFGCFDSVSKQIVVVPNTLNVSIMPPSSNLCEGDSVLLTSTVSGGYPAYGYLWSNLHSTANTWAKYTSSYYVDVTDSKLCFAKSNVSNILVNPAPKPEISGKTHLCVNTNNSYGVNYPAGLYNITWILDTTTIATNTSTLNLYASYAYLGNHVLIVKVESADGCIGYDTLHFSIHLPPTVNVSTTSTQLCQGSNNVLIGSTTSSNIMGQYWNTGATTDTITTMAAGYYSFTVVDSFGCSSTSAIVVHELPDFCGMMTGCYEICDTVQQLIWYAPPGYIGYQWFYNGVAIAGATKDTLHIPLYQAGTYTVKVTGNGGCSVMSEPIDISFVSCGKCVFAAKYKINCGPVNDAGHQTYNVTLQINNNLGNGANYTISTLAGGISGLTPATLVSGINTISFVFTDAPPIDDPACFKLSIYNQHTKCDTMICIKLPECKDKCEKKIDIKTLDCAGWDAAGNPIYNMCVNVNWGGSSGALLTINTASGSFSPNPVSLVSGSQTICFTYTDLPPTNTVSVFYFNIYDPTTGKTCVDSLKKEYKPCSDTCLISVQGLCAFCNNKNPDGTITYKIGVTVFNPLGTANVSVLPISSGTFGLITPNPIPSGMQQFHIYFTDNLPQDTIICFRILLNSGGKTCWQDICVSLPKCDGQYLGDEELTNIANSINVAPNPARDKFTVFYTIPSSYTDLSIEILDVAGKSIKTSNIDNMTGMQQFENLNLNAGVYYINVRSQGQLLGYKRIVIVK
jgi:PKD repeat protein